MKIQGKGNGEEITIVMDPYNATIGLRPVRFEAQIVMISTPLAPELDPSVIGGQPFVINTPGEYEIKKVYIEGVQAYADSKQGTERGMTTLFSVHLEDMHLVHLGFLGHELSSEQVEAFEDCDVLMIPVGNKGFLDVQQAMAVMSSLEPRIVIPMLYRIPGVTYDYEPIDAFLKELGVKTEEVLPKLKVGKKDLTADKTRVVVLEKT